MPHRIRSIVNAVRPSLVTDVDGILALFGEAWLVGNYAVLLLAPRGLRHTRRSGLKRILPVHITPAVAGKALGAGVCPFIFGVNLYVARATHGVVVVDNHLVLLPIALTWGKHRGTGIFEHRD